MKIDTVRIENFRSFEDETIYLGDYSCFVGPNGAGKSTVLTALNLFFRESENLQTDLSSLDEEDYHCKNVSEPITVTVTFSDLSDQAEQDFSDYVRHGRLVVSAEGKYDSDTGRASVRQYGQRLGIEAFRPFFEALGTTGTLVSQLKEIYSELRESFTDLPAPGTKNAMEEALRSYEASRQEECVLIPSEDQFYGFSKGANRLANHVQWVYVPAVKDATSEQVEARNSALGKILSRTVRSKTNFEDTVKSLRAGVQTQYQELLDSNQHVLDEISQSMQDRICEWAHPDAGLRLEWKQDPDKSVRVDEPWAHILASEGVFEGGLARFGHGLQRSYLLALLQELSDTDSDDAPKLILACEEPELYQHPPQARHLAHVLRDLSRKNAQALITTHSPWFISGEGFEEVRMVRKGDKGKCSVVRHMSFDDIAAAVADATGDPPSKPEGALAKIHQALQPTLSEMFFTRRLVLVEGLEDIAFLIAYIQLLDKAEEFRRLGCHIVQTNGKSELLRPLVLSRHMNIPTYVAFDSDADKPDRNGSRAKHEKDNKSLLKFLGLPEQDPFPKDTIWGSGFTLWHSDIGSTVATEIGDETWADAQQKADALYGQVGGLRKNSLHIGASLAIAWESGTRSNSLIRLCESIVDPMNVVPFTTE